MRNKSQIRELKEKADRRTQFASDMIYHSFILHAKHFISIEQQDAIKAAYMADLDKYEGIAKVCERVAEAIERPYIFDQFYSFDDNTIPDVCNRPEPGEISEEDKKIINDFFQETKKEQFSF